MIVASGRGVVEKGRELDCEQPLSSALFASTFGGRFIIPQCRKDVMDREELAEGYILTSKAGLHLLRRLALEGSLPASELEELCGGWEDWRHIVKLIEAGFAIDGPRGLMVSTKALDFVNKLFDS